MALSQFSRSVVSDSLRPHESQHARPRCPSPTPGVHSNSCAGGASGKKLPANAGDLRDPGWIPAWTGRYLGEGNGNQLLENPRNKGPGGLQFMGS